MKTVTGKKRLKSVLPADLPYGNRNRVQVGTGRRDTGRGRCLWTMSSA